MDVAAALIAFVTALGGLGAVMSILRMARARRRAEEELEREHAAWDGFALGTLEARERGYSEPALQPWTPAERDALGVNDTEKFILETDRVLNEIEWERLRAMNGTGTAVTTHLSTEEPAHYEVGDIWQNPDDGSRLRWSGQAWFQITPTSNALEVETYEVVGGEKIASDLHFERRRASWSA